MAFLVIQITLARFHPLRIAHAEQEIEHPIYSNIQLHFLKLQVEAWLEN